MTQRLEDIKMFNDFTSFAYNLRVCKSILQLNRFVAVNHM